MRQPFRLAAGGRVDRDRTLRFTFDGTAYTGHPGDTLASALLANGVHLVGRSFKYHRPRGIFSAGADEPSALIQLRTGPRTEPNTRATQIELHDGLVAHSQNRWPSLAFDVGAVNDVFSRLIPAGFYYKTFMWPASPRWWLRYEHLIRHAAGLGRSPADPDPDHYEHRYAHCDVLVVGAGAAGLAAARAAAASGARVIVCDEGLEPGGGLLSAATTIDDASGEQWRSTVLAALAARPDVSVLPRTTAFGYFDGNLVGLVERVADHLADIPADCPRQRVWMVRATRVVLATGALERPIAYGNNDLPGTLLAGSAETYLTRFGVRPGSRAVVFTNNDHAYASALALHAGGVAIAAIVDPRRAPAGPLPTRVRAAGIPILDGSVVVAAQGRLRVRSVEVAALGPDDVPGAARRRLDCDLVCVSGGWNPTLHLYSQSRGQLRYDTAAAAFLPDRSPAAVVAVGAAAGHEDLDAILADGHRAGLEAARLAGSELLPPRAPQTAAPGPLRPLWSVPSVRKRFVDLQNDVTADDVALAAREGYRSVEHLKRYTTLGMGTDQGKTSNVIGLALMAEQLGVTIPSVGTTTFRAPYTPVSIGALAGEGVGPDFSPTRRPSAHGWHVAHGARLIDAGLWKRAQMYPRPGESDMQAAYREALNVRARVGLVDVSTLGKIELQGRDVATFLNRVYVNRWDTLAVGRSRYGIMLREDGFVFDDGTTSRLADSHYLMTTTTANAVRVLQHLEQLLQIVWPTLDVCVTSTTEQWAAMALAGPNARAVLAQIVDIDVSDGAFPFMAVADCEVRLRGGSGTAAARLFRISYSGEMGYEIHVPAALARATWETVVEAGAAHGLMPYGTEAMGILRIEKGHVVIGAEIDGRTTADDLGLGRMVAAGKDCVGRALMSRPALTAPDRWQLVGLTGLSDAAADEPGIPRGAKLVAQSAQQGPILGHVTSCCYSPNLRRPISLALLANGRARQGELLQATSPLIGRSFPVRVCAPCFIDPEGARLRA